ncbi:sigma-54-dependent Fis family transcriptional regulator [Neobacillus mesonae]|uniref:sigma-54 interaction domain-containing protein n=1 Tax=Neobacillus mesonae TaxID=1193713 RepID=UPI00204058A2|nr:sigma 54-interacting transcriptional regulator [Neobacillus mesonae]MCM3571186.1 sigma 54-interacting transcriptional regulator [Neobacillus mesonae]
MLLHWRIRFHFFILRNKGGILILSLEQCLLVLEHIDGLIVVDKDARIIYINKKTADSINVDVQDVIKKHIKEVIPTTKIHHTVETRKPAIADSYFLENATLISTRYPIFQKDGEFFGVVEYDLFENYHLLNSFLKKINSLSNELDYFKSELRRLQRAKYTIQHIIGESSAAKRLREEVRQAASTNSTVLISGETGCGKELVAHAIHDLSSRQNSNFVRLNCAAIPSDLFESELFGYEDGAFTSAKKGGKEGKFQLANQGTLFLDEINQMPYSLQPKILRALQEKEIDRVGGKFSIPIDIRVISATNKDLRTLVKENKFREDLFYRLNVIHIRVPSLRERSEDIPLIAQSFINRLNPFLNRNVETISDEVLDMLVNYHWPGNIRELQNMIERAMNRISPQERELKIEHFDYLTDKENSPSDFIKNDNPLEEIKRQAEREAIIHVLKVCKGNKTKAAELLKISRPLLYQKMRRLDIQNSSF